MVIVFTWSNCMLAECQPVIHHPLVCGVWYVYTMMQISNKRNVSVRTFKGRVMVDIREYYEDSGSGELKPGRKGRGWLSGGQGLAEWWVGAG